MHEEPLGRGWAFAFRRMLASNPVVLFYVLAFAISWLGFVPVVLRSWGYRLFASALWEGALVLPAAGPGIAAAIASLNGGADQEGNALVRLRRAFFRPISLGWWCTTVLLSVGIMVVAALSTRLFVPGPASLLRPVAAPSLLLFAGMSLVANPLEEIGWRGFAQMRLQAHHSSLGAAGIVGVLWAAWHLPLFLLASGPMSMAGISLWPWAAGVVPQAVIVAWLYNRTGQSLATVSLFHVLGNVAGMVFASPVAAVSAVRVIAALAVIAGSGATLGCQGRLGEPGRANDGAIMGR